MIVLLSNSWRPTVVKDRSFLYIMFKCCTTEYVRSFLLFRFIKYSRPYFVCPLQIFTNILFFMLAYTDFIYCMWLFIRLVFLLNIAELVSDLEDSLRRVEIILIQQPGLTANLKDIQHQIKLLQVPTDNQLWFAFTGLSWLPWWNITWFIMILKHEYERLSKW